MSELMDEIKSLQKQVHHLTLLVMKDKVDTTWLKEIDAANCLGLKPEYLRRKVKELKPDFDITYRCTNGRNFEYSRKSIIAFKNKTAKN